MHWRAAQSQEALNLVAVQPSIHTVNSSSRMLFRHVILVGLVTSKISGYPWPTKDKTGKKTLGVNSISANVVRKDWLIYWDPGGWIQMCLQLLEKSAMPEDRSNRQQCIQLQNMRILLLNPDTRTVSPGRLLRYLLHEIPQTGRTVWSQAHHSKF